MIENAFITYGWGNVWLHWIHLTKSKKMHKKLLTVGADQCNRFFFKLLSMTLTRRNVLVLAGYPLQPNSFWARPSVRVVKRLAHWWIYSTILGFSLSFMHCRKKCTQNLVEYLYQKILMKVWLASFALFGLATLAFEVLQLCVFFKEYSVSLCLYLYKMRSFAIDYRSQQMIQYLCTGLTLYHGFVMKSNWKLNYLNCSRQWMYSNISCCKLRI